MRELVPDSVTFPEGVHDPVEYALTEFHAFGFIIKRYFVFQPLKLDFDLAISPNAEGVIGYAIIAIRS